jgi:hypothetical protein
VLLDLAILFCIVEDLFEYIGRAPMLALIIYTICTSVVLVNLLLLDTDAYIK